MIDKVTEVLKKIKSPIFVFIGVVAILIISIVFGLLTESSNINPLLLKNKYYAFAVGVLIAPFLETIIFQAIPFYLVNRYIKNKGKLYIFLFVSPILFIHNFNIAYMLISYLVGFIFAFMYYVASYRKENSILLVSAIHFINNLIAFSVYFFGI